MNMKDQEDEEKEARLVLFRAAKKEFEQERARVLARIPLKIKRWYGQIGFVKWKRSWIKEPMRLPVLVLGPFDVGPYYLDECYILNLDGSDRFLIFWYSDKRISVVQYSWITTYEDGLKKGFDKLPCDLQERIDRGYNLTKSQGEFVRITTMALEGMAKDLPKKPKDRKAGKFSFLEEYEEKYHVDKDRELERRGKQSAASAAARGACVIAGGDGDTSPKKRKQVPTDACSLRSKTNISNRKEQADDEEDRKMPAQPTQLPFVPLSALSTPTPIAIIPSTLVSPRAAAATPSPAARGGPSDAHRQEAPHADFVIPRATSEILGDLEKLEVELACAKAAHDAVTRDFVDAGIDSYTRELVYFPDAVAPGASYRALTQHGKSTGQLLSECFKLRDQIRTAQAQQDNRRISYFAVAMKRYVQELGDTHVVDKTAAIAACREVITIE